jgi:hypothetical protein
MLATVSLTSRWQVCKHRRYRTGKFYGYQRDMASISRATASMVPSDDAADLGSLIDASEMLLVSRGLVLVWAQVSTLPV